MLDLSTITSVAGGIRISFNSGLVAVDLSGVCVDEDLPQSMEWHSL
eukprot:SAG31_NODE_41848_length_274_cov_0.594286_1_plen_45_part_01